MKGAGVFKIFRARIVFSGRFSFIKREGGREVAVKIFVKE